MTDDSDCDGVRRSMPEVEQLALLSVCDGGPISEALLSKLFRRKLIKTVRRGTTLSPRLEREPTLLGYGVAALIRVNGTVTLKARDE